MVFGNIASSCSAGFWLVLLFFHHWRCCAAQCLEGPNTGPWYSGRQLYSSTDWWPFARTLIAIGHGHIGGIVRYLFHVRMFFCLRGLGQWESIVCWVSHDCGREMLVASVGTTHPWPFRVFRWWENIPTP